MDNDILNKRSYHTENTGQFTNRTSILNNDEIPKKVLVLEHYYDDMEYRHTLETKILNGLNWYDKLREQHNSLLEALTDLLNSYKADFATITGGELNDTVSVRKAKEAIKQATD